MQPPTDSADLIHVSARFRDVLEQAILALESGAAQDEQALPLLHNSDHRRRQRLLVGCQLLQAFRLRELLARTVLRSERAH